MKYCLTVRRFEEQDTNINCPFLSKYDDFDMYINSLIEDIGGIDGVLDVNREGSAITLNLEIEMNKTTLQEAMKPCFSDKRACEYKYVSLQKLRD